MTTADLMAPASWDVATAAHRYGWISAMVHALKLAAQLSPEGVDHRLRAALLKAMDECPALEAK